MKTYKALSLIFREGVGLVQPGEFFQVDDEAGAALVNSGSAEVSTKAEAKEADKASEKDGN